ncbi:MAG TPA: hypothetical protein VD997_16975 [Phycisphaerales bacterium]|nr:hypothetical protein [Phycisphaerales bacterium]
MMRPLIMSLCLLLTVPAVGQTVRPSHVLEFEDAPRPPKDANNAAWAYWKAWDIVQTEQDRKRFGELMTGGLSKGQKVLSKEQREELSRRRDYIEAVMQASAMEECDWGARHDKGYTALLPHLGFMRASTRALAMDARRCAEDGNSVACAERVVAMLRMAHHVSTDKYLISALVGAAVTGTAMNLTEELAKSDLITPAAARLILNELKKVNRDDPWHAYSAIDLERKITMDTFRKDWSGPDTTRRFIRLLNEISSLRGDGTGMHFPRLYLLSFNEQKIEREIQRAEKYFDALKGAWSKPNSAVALDELETEARELQFGIVAYVAGGAFSQTRRSMDRSLRQIDRVSVKLRAVVEETKGAAQ